MITEKIYGDRQSYIKPTLKPTGKSKSIIACCPEVFGKKGVLKNFAKFTGKRPCQSLFFNKAAGLRSATLFTLAQVFSCKFCRIFKNTFFL